MSLRGRGRRPLRPLAARQAPRQEGARQGAQQRGDPRRIERPPERRRDLVPEQLLEAVLQLEQDEALGEPHLSADVLGDGVRHLADLAHPGGGVDGARLVERLYQAVLHRLADARLRARERRPSSAERFTAVPMVWANTATRIATPSRKPSWRAVLSMPAPAPLWPTGTALIPAASSAGSERPMPAPTRALRQSTPERGSVRAMCPKAKRPAALSRA